MDPYDRIASRRTARTFVAVAAASVVVSGLAWLDWFIEGGSPAGVPYPVVVMALLAGNLVVTRRRPTLKRRVVAALQRWVVNPVAHAAVRLRLPLGWTLLETTGRRSGRSRVVPVGDGRDGARCWIIAEHGLDAGYVRNILADPRVRVRVRDGLRWSWRPGMAHVVLDDDPFRRQRRLVGWRHPMRALNALVVRVLAVDPVTIRIDLELLEPDFRRAPRGRPADRSPEGARRDVRLIGRELGDATLEAGGHWRV